MLYISITSLIMESLTDASALKVHKILTDSVVHLSQLIRYNLRIMDEENRVTEDTTCAGDVLIRPLLRLDTEREGSMARKLQKMTPHMIKLY